MKKSQIILVTLSSLLFSTVSAQESVEESTSAVDSVRSIEERADVQVTETVDQGSPDAVDLTDASMQNDEPQQSESVFEAITKEQVEELVEHIENTMFPKTAVSTYRLQSLKNDKVIKEFSFEMSLEADKSLLLMTWPAPAKPKVLLKSGKDLWMYFRDVKRSIRLSARDSFMGTDANNYDLMELNLLDDYTVNSFEEVVINDEKIVKVEMLAKEDTEGYSKIISWISPGQKRMLKNECFSISGSKIKTIEYREPFIVDEFSVPQSVLISSAVRKDRATLLTISNVRPQDDIDDLVFTLGYLESLD